MILLIDNYDSFTFNLVQFLGDLQQRSVVHRNDKITPEAALGLGADAIVISPGPCDPHRAGICLDLIQANAARGTDAIPLLGVCLGHQALGQAFGGKVIRGPVPMHGKLSPIHHDGGGVLAGLPTPFAATRYHSLIVERASLPDVFEIDGETREDSGDPGIVMAMHHKTLPFYGVQFHPESIASEHGHRVLSNFLAGRPLSAAA